MNRPPPVRGRPPGHPSAETRRDSALAAFSLLEVMIAMAIFFLAVFAILELTARNIRAARSLQQIPISASSLAAELSLTNTLEEGSESGDFGDSFPGATWTRNVILVGTNGLFEVDFQVHSPPGVYPRESTMSILLFRPDSPAGRGALR